jgi:hypothetical protein
LWWQLPDEPPRQRDLGQIVSVDNPPFAQRRAPPALLWDAPVWDAQRRDPLLVLVNDDPPYASRRAPAALAWDAPAWNAQSAPRTPQTPASAVNDPPFASRRAPPALAWEQMWWNAQTRDPLVVLVNDNPPFGARPWVSRLVALWQPIPPERVIVRRYTADNPLIPGVFPPDSPVHFRISVPTRRLGEPNEAPEPERLGNSSESPQPSRLGEANESPDSERLGSANITPPARRLGEENT